MTTSAYRTERFKIYDKAKEYRLKHYKDALEANEKGRMVVLGNFHAPKEFMLAMFPDMVFVAGEPWGVFVTREGEDTNLPRRAVEEVEKHGFKQDMCGYMRMSWGSMWLNESPGGKPFPKPDMVLATNQCDYKGKWNQVLAEELGVPFYCVESGSYLGDGSWKPPEASIKYLVNQYYDLIDWLEKRYHRKFDEQKFIELMVNTWISRCMWTDVIQMQSHVPAPLEFKLLLPFFMIMEYWSYKKEMVGVLTEFRDETKYRIEQGITPMPDEKARVMHEGLPPWYALNMFTYLREHKVAVLAGSNHFMFMPAVLPIPDDGWYDPGAPINWTGAPKTLEEAMRFRAVYQWHTDSWGIDTRRKIYNLKVALKMLKAQGVIIEQDRGCEFFSLGVPEMKRAAAEAGYSTMLYEANRVDQREWSWPHVSDALDAFIESLGLSKGLA